MNGGPRTWAPPTLARVEWTLEQDAEESVLAPPKHGPNAAKMTRTIASQDSLRVFVSIDRFFQT